MSSIIQYNKLVRDNIPEIIEASGKTCKTFKVDEQFMLTHLITKLSEEFHEFLTEADKKSSEGMIEELVDLKTVIDAIIPRISSFTHFDMIETIKNNDRGQYFNNVFLMEVTDDRETD